jgi:hypothetical protein
MTVVLRCMMAEAASVEMWYQIRPNVADADLLSSIRNPAPVQEVQQQHQRGSCCKIPKQAQSVPLTERFLRLPVR